jgi:hypothetical protein
VSYRQSQRRRQRRADGLCVRAAACPFLAGVSVVVRCDNRLTRGRAAVPNPPLLVMRRAVVNKLRAISQGLFASFRGVAAGCRPRIDEARAAAARAETELAHVLSAAEMLERDVARGHEEVRPVSVSCCGCCGCGITCE